MFGDNSLINTCLYKPVNLWNSAFFLVDAAQIEEECYEYPWDYNMLLGLKDSEENLRGIGIASYSNRTHAYSDLMGYIISDGNEILNISVDPKFQRRGIGKWLIDKLKGEQGSLFTHVWEGNLDAQLFLRDQGFIAEIEDDMKGIMNGNQYYLMTYDPFSVKNRVKDYFSERDI